jgi:hypothetical protein
MRNLLEIETGLLGSDAVTEGLQLNRVKSLQQAIKSAERTKFRKQLEMASLMRQGKDWFDKPETQLLFTQDGVVWTTVELADKVFELSQSRMYRCIKASNVPLMLVNIFESQCKVLQNAGEKVEISIDSLNQFAKAYAEDDNVSVWDLQSTDNDTVVNDSEQETDEDSNTESSADTIFTMYYRLNASQNIAVRYSAIDGLVTTNSASEIRHAIDFLTEQL